MRQIKFFWLGSPVIVCGSAEVHMETQKAAALLAFLSLSPVPPTRASLASLFWPEADRAHALSNLRRNLFSIHRAIGPDILIADRHTIEFNPDLSLWSDAHEFHQRVTQAKSLPPLQMTDSPDGIDLLETAVHLCRGDFLEEIRLQDCPEFTDWQYFQRESYRQDLEFCLEELTNIYSSRRDWDKAIQNARKWVSLDPLIEKAQRMLIQGLAQIGQRNAALHHFEVYSSRLKDELDRLPEEKTVALIEKIKSGRFESSAEYSNRPGQSQEKPNKQPLISTKLFIPSPRAGMVPRLNLALKLEEASRSTLTLISAPAGYGKTTLLSEWVKILQKDPSPWSVCWYSLDEADNDPTKFLSYLTSALEKINPKVGTDTRSIMQSSPTQNPSTPLSILINNLQEQPQSILMVLDDYQFISNSAVHEGVAFLLEHLPSNVHVVIATRSDPPFPLARLRGRNQLTEIRASDLRFTAAEINDFFTNIFNLSLTPAQAAKLENRTEGWIAGIQMAAISMHGRLDIDQFIDAFSGSHRFIMDYLAEEALNRQTPETQEFLFRTSILEQLNDSLCEYVLGGEPENPGSPSTIYLSNSRNQNRLTRLESLNLFIVPLDDERIWYRYHHLFKDLLQTRLYQSSPGLVPLLHIRASQWFEKNGWIEESITHSLAAKDWGNAIRLVVQNIPAHLENGQMATVIQWIEILPQEEIFKNPKLCTLVAETYSQAGLIDQIDPYLDKAEELLSAGIPQNRSKDADASPDLSIKERTVILAMSGILRGLKSVCSGDPHRALALIQNVLARFTEMEPKELAVLYWVQGWAYRSLGNLDQSIISLTRATNYALESGANLRDTWTDLAVVTRVVGKLSQSIEIISRSLQFAADRGVQNQGNLSRDESFLSFLYLEQNQLDLALTHANRAIAYTQWWPSHNILALAYTSLAQNLLARNDLEGSEAAIQKADHERQNRLMTPFVHCLVDITFVQIWLMRNEWALLDHWSDRQISMLDTVLEKGSLIDEYLEMRLIMLVRVWMVKARIDQNLKLREDCYQLLVRLENNSRSAGRINSLVEILFLKESIRFAQGKIPEAVKGLEECFSLAEPGGYMRIFLNTGESIRDLVFAYIHQPNPLHKHYANKILGELDGSQRKNESKCQLPEPITSREMEVLQLLAEGCSNRQIAEKLIVSEGTVKFHVHNLLAKLQAENRTQAILKAKNLSLL